MQYALCNEVSRVPFGTHGSKRVSLGPAAMMQISSILALIQAMQPICRPHCCLLHAAAADSNILIANTMIRQLWRMPNHQMRQTWKKMWAEGGRQSGTCLWVDLEGEKVAISQGTQQVGHPLKLSKQQAPGNDLQPLMVLLSQKSNMQKHCTQDLKAARQFCQLRILALCQQELCSGEHA